MIMKFSVKHNSGLGKTCVRGRSCPLNYQQAGSDGWNSLQAGLVVFQIFYGPILLEGGRVWAPPVGEWLRSLFGWVTVGQLDPTFFYKASRQLLFPRTPFYWKEEAKSLFGLFIYLRQKMYIHYLNELGEHWVVRGWVRETQATIGTTDRLIRVGVSFWIRARGQKHWKGPVWEEIYRIFTYGLAGMECRHSII